MQMKRILTLLLVLVMLFSAAVMNGCAPKAEDNFGTNSPSSENPAIDSPAVESVPVTVIACSDFQNPGGNEASAEFVTKVLTRISQDHESVDGFLCSGDYDFDLT